MNKKNSIKVLFLGVSLVAGSCFAMETDQVYHRPKIVRQRRPEPSIYKIQKNDFYDYRKSLVLPGDCLLNAGTFLGMSMIVGVALASKYLMEYLHS